MLRTAAALLGTPAAGSIDNNSLHGLRRRAKKMRSIREGRRRIGPDELKPRIMDERGGLQTVARCLAGKPLLSHAVEFRIDQIEQLFLSLAFTTPGGFEELRHTAHVSADYSYGLRFREQLVRLSQVRIR